MNKIPKSIKAYGIKPLLASMLLFFSCSSIPENNDPVLGIWTIEFDTAESSKRATSDKREWIFNDIFRGRYHYYQNQEIVIENDFGWSSQNDVYTIEYIGTDLPDDVFTIQEVDGVDKMMDSRGQVIGVREYN